MTALLTPASAAALATVDTRQIAWLVRHAPTAWTGRRWCGRSDPPLAADGRRVAAMLAERLALDLPHDVTILSSPLRRARQTALAIAGAVGRPVSILPELVEVDFGRVEGLTWGELSTHEPALAGWILRGGPVDWPGGETAAAVSDRVARIAATVRELDGPVVVVGHGCFLAALHGRLAAGVFAPQLGPWPPAGVIRVRLAGCEGNG